ncbi:syntaphilin domain-containing protein [Aliarcobacter butzleri]|uniref:syntaphilin domain-containing protein n=1 Tax=Aliarcobacter butzleri TaxID=28197 RepID=UPI001EDC5685|nr:syntaphilin domain-containing protein [Aliarcobacter butzleri]MCG3667504.1 syntaphilin domain-containing protein [Aliarcobacter butzleri]
MIVRVRRNKTGGLAKYLRDGVKKDSNFLRNEKDIVIPIWGNLDEFEKIEDYVLNEKKFSEISMHITFGFSDNDWQKIESLLTKEQQNALMQELVQDYIKHHFSGYDIYNEVIVYSELHYPKLKYDEYGYKRYPHIHLAVSFLNPLSDTKLRNLFAINSYYDDVMVRKSNFKFGFEQTKRKEFRIKNFDSQLGRDRREWIELLDELNDKEELIYFLENQMNFKEEIDYRVVDTKYNNYVKLINKSFKNDKSGKKTIQDINLQGRGFERFVDVTSTEKNHKKLEDMTQEELEKILNQVYAKRVDEIAKRRSKKSTEDLKKIYEDDEQIKKDFEKKYSKKAEYNSFKSLTFQQKIFYKHYGVNIQDSLEGYYIKVDENNENNATFINHSKGIKIEDKEDEILSYSNEDSTQEEVKLMLDIALAKGWNLLEIEIDGTPQFIKETKKQILIKVEVQNQTQKKEEENKEIKKVEIKPTRPVSQLDNYIFENESKIFESEKANDLKFLKENLSAQIVLDFAIRKYNINLDEFEVVDDNKINNKTNRQKPKSIIDFFTKEIGVSIKETTEICNNLMTKQPKKVVDKIEDEEKSQELIYPYIDKNLEQNKEILNEKNKRKKRKN